MEKVDAFGVGLDLFAPSKEEIVSYAASHPTGDSMDRFNNLKDDYRIGFQFGYLSELEETYALNTIKLIRFIAGISDNIYLSDEYIEKAHAAAFVNHANGTLSHYPSMPSGINETYAKLGIQASQDCNLAKYNHPNVSMKYAILDGWMDDSDSTNIQNLGHRRWILSPKLGMVGFGAVTDDKATYSAMYVTDRSSVHQDNKAICWPAENMPTSLFNANQPWCISLGSQVNIDEVKVRLIRFSDNRNWYFSKESSDGDFYISNLDYGQKGCVIFRPAGINKYDDGETFYVMVSGIGEDTISYTVDFFDLEGFYAAGVPTLNSVTINSVDKPVIKWSKIKNALSYNLYRKSKGGSWKLLKSDIDTTSYTDKNAGKGIKYYYKVSSVNIVDGINYESDASNSITVTIKQSKPTITSAKAVSKKKNKLAWKAVSKASGYEVYRRLYGSSKWTLMKDTTDLSYTNSSSKSGKKYQYRVRAYRIVNDNTVYGYYSDIKTIKTK